MLESMTLVLENMILVLESMNQVLESMLLVLESMTQVLESMILVQEGSNPHGRTDARLLPTLIFKDRTLIHRLVLGQGGTSARVQTFGAKPRTLVFKVRTN